MFYFTFYTFRLFCFFLWKTIPFLQNALVFYIIRHYSCYVEEDRHNVAPRWYKVRKSVGPQCPKERYLLKTLRFFIRFFFCFFFVWSFCSVCRKYAGSWSYHPLILNYVLLCRSRGIYPAFLTPPSIQDSSIKPTFHSFQMGFYLTSSKGVLFSPCLTIFSLLVIFPFRAFVVFRQWWMLCKIVA